MKNPILRLVIGAIVFSLACGIAITIAGLVRGWNTYTQFSDAYFWAGAIIVSIGLINLFGALSARTVSGLQYSETSVHLDSGERFRIWAGDIVKSHRLLAFLGIAGMLLLGMAGLAILVGRAL